MDIYNEGILLFDSEKYILEEPVGKEDLPKDVRLTKASFYYEKWLKSADGFLLGFENYYKLKEYKLAVFNLHQTAEHLYMGILLVYTDYKPKTHNLLELNQEVIDHDYRFEEAFPCKTVEEDRLFKKLKDAYIDSRYDDDFIINEGELIYMAGRVRILQSLAEKICNEYIQTYSKDVPEISKELKARIEKLAESGADDFYEVRKAAREEEKKLIAEAENRGEIRGEERGLEKGKVLGKKEGRNEKAIEIAKKLLVEGVAVEDVARVTDLSVAEVLEIE